MSYWEDSLNEDFDDNIPQEVLNDDSWSPRLLPDISNLNNIVFTFDDVIETEEDSNHGLRSALDSTMDV